MCKKKFFLIGLQVAVLAGFVMMALGSGSNAAVVKSTNPKRMDRGACGHADYVLMGSILRKTLVLRLAEMPALPISV